MTPKQRTKPKPKISEYDREAAANAVEFASSENLEITAMTLEDALTEFVATHNLAPQQLELAQRLVWVEEIGVSEHYDRSEMHELHDGAL